ncbi:ABC transporter ATP-binding protein [Streptococcus sciuri]|uniref:ATP-binding cassette domain-containing protein n=1 Tax=Streptococcus sciuri TaxID=2973939 RepID=A0ABT2F4Z9_9STRE|nr:ATP-binding cassette domain-containing protein [Streptococcus sciuri]MCS4487502.1 ATP-binding cassette domain-containing protein [Streptococcus sciuri]
MKILNLSKMYGKQLVLDNISVEINKGQIVGLVGNNGSGKTTLLKCIAKLIVDYRGEIDLNGTLSFSIENPSFYDELSVQSNLELFAILAEQKNFNCTDILKLVKLEESKSKKFKQLSLGMKQKLSIARILLSDSDIVLLDEPFNGLDILTKEQLKELILLLRSKGKLIIVSSHILEELGEISDVIWYLRDGKIQNIINLNDNKRVYKIVVPKGINIPSYLQKQYNILWRFDKKQTSIFRLEVLQEDIHQVLKSLIVNDVKVIEYTDVTSDIKELMMDERR